MKMLQLTANGLMHALTRPNEDAATDCQWTDARLNETTLEIRDK